MKPSKHPFPQKSREMQKTVIKLIKMQKISQTWLRSIFIINKHQFSLNPINTGIQYILFPL